MTNMRIRLRTAAHTAGLGLGLLLGVACSHDDKWIYCQVEGNFCSCSFGSGYPQPPAACGSNLSPAALCCASPPWPAESGSCTCSSTNVPGNGTCVSPLVKVTQCFPVGVAFDGGSDITFPSDDAAAVCRTGGTPPDGLVCCGSSFCDLATQACCITNAPPQTLSCAAKGASCAGMAKGCNGPSDCGGNACCQDGQGAANCASGSQCTASLTTVCRTAADCPSTASQCCGIDLVLVPTGHFQYGACRASCG